MRLNLAVFTSDYTNMQLTYRGPAPAGVAPFITNAGETSIDGAEAEFTWAPTDRSAASTRAWVTSTRRSTASSNIPLAVLPPGLVEGNFLPFAPEWQAHLGIAYTGARRHARDQAACRCVVPADDVLRCDQHARDRAARRRDDGECIGGLQRRRRLAVELSRWA